MSAACVKVSSLLLLLIKSNDCSLPTPNNVLVHTCNIFGSNCESWVLASFERRSSALLYQGN